MIDALFGSKTRVKLLHLFLNNPGKSFYVREITRLIDEQINSVRRELSNMSTIGIISTTSDKEDNKLYYEVNQRYEHYVALRAIFADQPPKTTRSVKQTDDWQPIVVQLHGLRIAIAAGVLVQDSASKVDLLLVGSMSSTKVKSALKSVERLEGRELTYSVLTYDEFYYRLSVRDKFITEILNSNHLVVTDTDNVLKSQK
jgi:Fe2+ or Zn2+ uptake regulation protein